MSHPQIGNRLTFKLLHWSTDASSSIPDCIHPGGPCRPVQSSLYTTFPTITLALATIGLRVWTNLTSHTFTWTPRLQQIESYLFPKLPRITHVVSNQYKTFTLTAPSSISLHPHHPFHLSHHHYPATTTTLIQPWTRPAERTLPPRLLISVFCPRHPETDSSIPHNINYPSKHQLPRNFYFPTVTHSTYYIS